MGFSNVLLLSQLTGHIVALILSLCITIPMGIHQEDFSGHCLLFSTGVWREADGQFDVSWASQGFCNYTIFVGVILFVISAVQIYRLSLLLYRGQDSSFLSAFMDVVQSTILCCMTLSAALIVTLGFDSWCRSITQRFETCEDATDNDIDKKDKIDTSSFYIQIGTAQFGAWASWACCVGLCVFATLKLCRYHQEENMRLSMALARERLIKNAISDHTINSDHHSKYGRRKSSMNEEAGPSPGQSHTGHYT
ncbi:unnamed protein product [Allacma fusca]|uniref:Transmembrane protein 179 n=1 Tax=Allacma fusca TaxID=39272 RepID=A0A8J2LRT3_9HEXA|nr:unnamed protein product [Allacma fusca]